MVVGRDMRPHSPALVRELQRGLLASGVRVIDVGLVDTPFLYWAVNELNGAGAIQTTASHNPIQYNGFKISGPGAAPIGRESGLQDIEALAAGCNYQPGDGTPAVEHLDLWDGYRKHIHRFLPASLLDGTVRLKVAVDASNGMAGTMVPKVFSDLPGLELIELHFENDQGSFVHEPNPLVEANLAGLKKRSASMGVILACVLMAMPTGAFWWTSRGLPLAAISPPHGSRPASSPMGAGWSTTCVHPKFCLKPSRPLVGNLTCRVSDTCS